MRLYVEKILQVNELRNLRKTLLRLQLVGFMLVTFTISFSLVACLTEKKIQVDVVRNIEYGRQGDESLLLDIYIPITAVPTPMPAIIAIHGGNWKDEENTPGQINDLAQQGFIVVSVNYQLFKETVFPAPIENTKCAVRWLKVNASKYNVDSERIGVWGTSATGYMALMAGLVDKRAEMEGLGGWNEVSSNVQAICVYYGPTDFVDWATVSSSVPLDNQVEKLLGGRFDQIPDRYVLASPVTYVSPDDPPLLLIHGDMDQVVPFRQSELMYQSYKKISLEATLIKVKNAGHSFIKATDKPISPTLSEIDKATEDFFIKTLKKK
jgi:acetyl esterase/lipase